MYVTGAGCEAEGEFNMRKRETGGDKERERGRTLPPKLDLVACALLLLILASST